MAEQISPVPERSTEEPEQKQSRERSSIAFPYGDLKSAIEVARALQDHGGGRGNFDSLAVWVGHESSKSGTFRQKVYTARDFELIEIEKQMVRLLNLGGNILNPEKEASARAEAFLRVPLYSQIFEAYRGGLLPKDVGLERQMETLGVAEKQTSKARQAFARSAEQAGYFAYGNDRLVCPAVPELGEGEPNREPPPRDNGREPPGGSSKSIMLPGSGGAILRLSLSTDVLGLVRDDRKFVLGLIEAIEEYEERSEPKQLAASSDEPTAAEQAAV